MPKSFPSESNCSSPTSSYNDTLSSAENSVKTIKKKKVNFISKFLIYIIFIEYMIYSWAIYIFY